MEGNGDRVEVRLVVTSWDPIPLKIHIRLKRGQTVG